MKGIDFDIAPGEVFGLLGPNGAGKSTTIGMLTTTIAPTAGAARLAGFDVATEPIAARGVSGVVFQDTVVDMALTGRRNLDIHARLWNVDPADAAVRIAELAPAFGLEELLDRPLSTFSGGQRRRLEIARALISQPLVMFLDEPTVGLDPRIRYELLDLIAGLRTRDEMTILLTTHYLDEAERLCDRVAIVHEGRIVAMDRPAALLESLASIWTQTRAPDEIVIVDDGNLPDEIRAQIAEQCWAATIPFRFGRASARRHQLEAQKRALSIAVVERESLAFDVDTPEDLAALERFRTAHAI